METVLIPDSVQVIGRSSFQDCVRLATIDIPDSVQVIESYAFRGCVRLETIDISNSVQKIGRGAFDRCVCLKSVKLSKGIEIGAGAFNSCTALKSITIPQDAILHKSCFSHSGLVEIKISSKVKEVNGFNSCHELIEVILPEGVKMIHQFAFSDCDNLMTVTIPDSVVDIAPLAFGNCPKLTTVIGGERFSSSCFNETPYGKSRSSKNQRQGCYIATAVYGSYDCPEVWVLRRFRDYSLAKSYYGRIFIKIYYKISPILVKWFGNTYWFKKLFSKILNKRINNLIMKGIADTPYQDRQW